MICRQGKDRERVFPCVTVPGLAKSSDCDVSSHLRQFYLLFVFITGHASYSLPQLTAVSFLLLMYWEAQLAAEFRLKSDRDHLTQ